jgi:hypothetical membrane protein
MSGEAEPGRPFEPEAANADPGPRRLYWVVAGGILLYATLDVIAQLLPPHYSAVTQAESDLAVGPYGYVMTVNFVVRGLVSLLFLFALTRTVDGEPNGRATLRSGRAFFALWAVGALVLAVFPTDVPSTPVSWHGAIHLVVALLAFFGGAVGVFALADHFHESRTLAPAKRWAFPFAIVVVLLFVVEIAAGFAVPRLAARYGGLTERLFLGSVLAWMFSVSVWLARRPTTGPTVARGVAVGPPGLGRRPRT